MDDTVYKPKHNPQTQSHEAPSYGTFVMVWLGLLALTTVTVSVAGFHLGPLTIVTALVIAGTKTMLVVNYFMHLKYEMLVFKIFLAVCIITFITFTILTFFDYSYR
jgi:cytochrome c oxidase subunit 4